MAPTHDVILYGATGFTGKLVAAYLDKHPQLRGRPWAVAGRSLESITAVRATLSSPSVSAVACKLTDPVALEKMVASTKVLISTAGPYSAYDGDKLLGACARLGVSYSDLSGEGFWQREMIEDFHSVAQKSGAKIVLGGGVDSIPSDLGTLLALQGLGQAEEQVRVTGVYTEYSGAFSGGTLNSGEAMAAAKKSGRIKPGLTSDPYLLGGEVTRGLDSQVGTLDGMPRGFSRQLDRAHGCVTKFFMGAINAPVVRRSLALRGCGARVSYRECCSVGMWLRLLWLWTSRGLGYFVGAPIKLRPASGEGPPAWMLRDGAFAIHVTARAEASRRACRAVVSGRGDPGYGATSKMLGEVALCLLLDRAKCPQGGGVLTPATAMGAALVERLATADGGEFMRLEVVERP